MPRAIIITRFNTQRINNGILFGFDSRVYFTIANAISGFACFLKLDKLFF